MQFTAISFVFAISVSVAFSQSGFTIPHGYCLVPINNFVRASPTSLSGPTLTSAAARPRKSETFSTHSLDKTEIRDDSVQYAVNYVILNGILVNERSYLKPFKEGYVPVREGTYEHGSPEGIVVSFGYKADDNGYVFKGYPLILALAPIPAKA